MRSPRWAASLRWGWDFWPKSTGVHILTSAWLLYCMLKTERLSQIPVQTDLSLFPASGMWLRAPPSIKPLALLRWFTSESHRIIRKQQEVYRFSLCIWTAFVIRPSATLRLISWDTAWTTEKFRTTHFWKLLSSRSRNFAESVWLAIIYRYWPEKILKLSMSVMPNEAIRWSAAVVNRPSSSQCRRWQTCLDLCVTWIR